MKKFFIVLLLFLFSFTGCFRVVVDPVPEDPFMEDLSGFLTTKSSEPLENTLWVSHTGEDFDRYLLFKDNEVNLFYGLFEADELQRWSDYFKAPYQFTENNRALVTDLSYPVWGQRNYEQYITILQSVDSFTLKTASETFEYFGSFQDYEKDIEDEWILVYVGISPWE